MDEKQNLCYISDRRYTLTVHPLIYNLQESRISIDPQRLVFMSVYLKKLKIFYILYVKFRYFYLRLITFFTEVNTLK